MASNQRVAYENALKDLEKGKKSGITGNDLAKLETAVAVAANELKSAAGVDDVSKAS